MARSVFFMISLNCSPKYKNFSSFLSDVDEKSCALYAMLLAVAAILAGDFPFRGCKEHFTCGLGAGRPVRGLQMMVMGRFCNLLLYKTVNCHLQAGETGIGVLSQRPTREQLENPRPARIFSSGDENFLLHGDFVERVHKIWKLEIYSDFFKKQSRAFYRHRA